MSESSTPVFRSIGDPLDVDDKALDRLAGMMGVPSLVRGKPVQTSAGENGEEGRRQTEKLTIVIPAYLMDALRQAAAAERTTVRHLVMSALRAHGYEIAETDMTSDGRRTRHTRDTMSV
ncbi:MAG: hypothetical protein EBS23_02785 [Betaproteobacteria bacterium]|nr:hypothetical protein [Betaproteobacteria bacterium]